MEVTLALLADAANTTANHTLNVLGAFTNINPDSIPHVHPAMTLVVKFEADAIEAGQEKAIAIVLVEPDGKELTRLEFSQTLPLPPERGTTVELLLQMALNGLRFDRSGPHHFAITVNGEMKRRIPLNVSQPAMPEETPI